MESISVTYVYFKIIAVNAATDDSVTEIACKQVKTTGNPRKDALEKHRALSEAIGELETQCGDGWKVDLNRTRVVSYKYALELIRRKEELE